MDLKLLATLKDKLIHAQDFSDIWTYFFDHFGEDSAFIALGERAQDSFLESIIEQVGLQLFPNKVLLRDVLLTQLADHHFIHGGFIINGRLANVLYFEDIHMGLLAVVTSLKPTETKMIRFTGWPMPEGYQRSRN